MHAIVLTIVIFFSAANGVPEHAEAKAVAAPAGTTGDECMAAGAAISSKAMQTPGVAFATWTCVDASNPADKAA